MMRKLLLMFVCAVTFAGISQAGLISLNGSDIMTSYTASTKVLLISDTVTVTVEDSSGDQTAYDGVFVQVQTTLASDDSANNIASGVFDGGTISYTDSSGNILLSGTVDQIAIAEVSDGWGLMAGAGAFQVTGGQLASEFPDNLGEIVQLSFSVTPATISNYSSDFSARTNLSLLPVPEPATIAMLSFGGLSLLRRKRRA